MFIKQAVANVGRRIFQEKQASVAGNFILQWLFFTTLKDYLYRLVTAENLFVISDQIKQRASKKKLILVLDMDQTLVYTRGRASPGHSNYIETEVNLNICSQKGKKCLSNVGRLLDNFQNQPLKFLQFMFTLLAKKNNADTVLNVLDTDKLIQKRFYRESCKKNNGILIKDLKYLKKMTRAKQEMILVDDNSQSINYNYPFALKVEAFEGNQQDRELVRVFERIIKFYH